MITTVKGSQVLNGGQGIAEVLKVEEVEKVFCVPGESYLPLMDAIYDYSDIQLISTRHENGAAFMAEGYAKSTGKVGVCMATRGVGSTNLAVGIHTAHQDSTPMVIFVGQLRGNVREREGFQEIKLNEFYSHITKWSVEINDVKRVPELVHRAFRVAKSGRPGPVLVGLPIDMLYATSEMKFQKSMLPAPPSPNKEILKEANQLLANAEKPLIIAGGGVTGTRAHKELLELSELTSIPVMTSFRRHDAFPNDHPNYGGHVGLSAHPKIIETIQEADVILAIGMKFSQVFTQEYTLLKEHTKLIHIDINDQAVGKVYETEIGIVSDAKQALKELILLNRHETSKKLRDRAAYCQRIRKIYEEISLPRKQYREDFVDQEGMIYDLQELLPESAMIVNCAGNYTGWIHKYYQFTKPNTYLGPTSGAMGYSLPAALAAKLAYPDRKVVSIAGDGGFMMTVQELATSVQYNIPVIIIVVNNNMYGTIRMHQEKSFPKREIGTNLTNPNFTDLAKSFGIETYQARNNREFHRALQNAIKSDESVFVEVSADPNVISVSKTIEALQQNV
ncbi:thiamine pyrophosphate-dependent enzyme [Oceanobacillus timonensis]|uniref:thiamine pyrophosphate-dependent enzyme n=1 Tax=Oceanobacillus timonensis TaxID=1926285 RepID=UPI0009BAF242|nr:thiamine pyrophosphate-dependent enzyme [Oceanobacillus timonensis]